jgi:tRNA(Ile)-lysidine synthase
LRGKDSEDDASFVKNWCVSHNIPYIEHKVDTKQYAVDHKLNTQSAAREIRYNWWKTLVDNKNFDHVATAHHQNDRIESFFLNLLRGTGMKGLTSIPVQRDFYIRPLMNVTRSEIETFASEHQIPFRTDRSNESDDYMRNRIRHHLIPMLMELNGNFESVMAQVLQRNGLEWAAWEFAFHQWEQINVIEKTGSYDLKASKPEQSFLFKWLEYGGNRLSRTISGFYFEKNKNTASILIPEPGTWQSEDDEFSIELVSIEEYKPGDDPWTEYADLSAIHWPLEIRGIQPGDHFQPIGMLGKSKKIQDYLVDLKLEQHEKNNVKILKSNDQVLWLVGKRLDDRIKVKSGIKEIYKLQFRPGGKKQIR